MSEHRIIVGPCRSGTTMLLRSMKNHPDAEVEFQTIKAGQRATGMPDYGFFNRDVASGKFLVDKETVGYGTDADCLLSVFPNDEAIRQSHPLFIFREPRDVYQSWLENNLVPEKNPRLFIQAYRHVFSLLLHARSVSKSAAVMTYEELCKNPKGIIEAACEKWSIGFHPNMVDWKDDFIDTTPLDTDGVAAGHYAEVAGETGIHRPRQKHPLSDVDSAEIIATLGSIYEQIRALSL